MKYRILVSDRKKVAAEMEKITGQKTKYTGVPRCAYILNGVAIERTSIVTTEEDADTELLTELIGAGLIEQIIEDEPTEENAASDNETADEAATEEASKGVSEEETEEEETEEEVEEGVQDSSTASVADYYRTAAPYATEPRKVTVSLPLDKHTADSICNLVFTIYSKGSLISKATQGEFKVSESLVDELKGCKFVRMEEAFKVIRNAGKDALIGLTFEEDKVTFDGFPETADPDEVKAWTTLASAINKACIKQMHVRPKETDETNERFTFRTWLTRLGLNGNETKAERSILYRHITGHTAFRTDEDREKWTKRQNEKRDALRKLKEGALEEAENGSDGAED